MKKRILIPYASYGNGHKAIAEYIKTYFEDASEDFEIRTLDLLSYSIPVLGTISQKLSLRLMLKHPHLWSMIYAFFDNKIRGSISNSISLSLFKNKKLKNEIRKFNPDLTISTHFFGSSLIAYCKKKGICSSKLITVVTDHNAHEFWLKNIKVEDAIVVGNKEEGINLINKGFDKKKIKAYGIPIAPKLGDNFNREKMLKKYNFSGEKLICLFFAGGGIGSNAVLPYIKRVMKMDLNIDFLFICGKNKKLKEKIEEIVKENDCTNIQVFGYVNNIPQMFSLSDFVITKPGGAQTTEALYFKKPTILINDSGGQERGNARYLVANGYAKRFRLVWTFSKYLKEISKKPKILDDILKKVKKNNSDKAMQKLYNLALEILKDRI